MAACATCRCGSRSCGASRCRDDRGGRDRHGGGELSRSIGLFQLSMFGIGATIGTGIFIVLTQAVPVAGPAVIWSFVIAGTVAGLTAICYAELASAVPVSGSSYSYAYATLGEGVAMVVAACLLLEYGVVRRGGRGRLVAVPQRAARQPVRLHDPGEPVASARGRRDPQPARGGAGRALHAAADPRRERVGEGQRRDGADQARRAGPVHRARRAGLGARTTCRTSRRSGSAASRRPRGSSSSPTSASTRSRPRARRSRTRGGRCRWRSSSRWSR